MKSKNLIQGKIYFSGRTILIVIFVGLVLLAIFQLIKTKEGLPLPTKLAGDGSGISMSYHTNIAREAKDNDNFRRVLFTGPKSQLVVMSIPPGGEVGQETHKYTEQTLFFVTGEGEGELDGKKFPLGPGDAVVVTAGTRHNFWNTGKENLKLYTVYAPPNHIDGRVHQTKADADADTQDEAIGQSEPK